MNQPTTWTASTLAEAQDIIRAVRDRVDSSARAAYAGLDAIAVSKAAYQAPVSLTITFDISALEQVAADRNTPVSGA